MSNLQEYEAGTNPNEAGSRLALAASAQLIDGSKTIRLQWQGQAGKSYQLQYLPSVPGASWQAVGSPVISTASGVLLSVEAPVSPESNGFYRVGTQL
jgi:hypothetical protein